MKEEEFKSIIDSIQGKLGEEASSIIADDIGKLYTANSTSLNEIKSRTDEINNLKSTNEKLVLANGNLLKQVPMAKDYDKHPSDPKPEEPKKSFNFMSLFDEKGHFKKGN